MRVQAFGLLALCLAGLAGAGCASDPATTQIRIRNESAFDFKNVIADTDLAFGDLPAGATSGYLTHDATTGFGSVHLAIGATTASFEPSGGSGAPNLGSGFFTYHVTATASGSGFWLGVVATAE